MTKERIEKELSKVDAQLESLQAKKHSGDMSRTF